MPCIKHEISGLSTQRLKVLHVKANKSTDFRKGSVISIKTNAVLKCYFPLDSLEGQ